MKEIFERFISSVYTDDEKKYLVFIDKLTFLVPDEDHPEGVRHLVYVAKGECCSYSWFESINPIENLINKRVIGVEKKEEECVECNHDESKCEKAYGYTIKTQNGYCDIEFRNSSNTFYGGSCSYIPAQKTEILDYDDKGSFDLPPHLTLKIYEYDGFTLVNLHPWGTTPEREHT